MRIGLDLPDDTKVLSVTIVRDTNDITLIEPLAFKITDGSIYKLSDGMAEEVE